MNWIRLGYESIEPVLLLYIENTISCVGIKYKN